MSRKRGNLYSENKNGPKRDIRVNMSDRCTPRKRGNLYSENKNGPKRDIRVNMSDHCTPRKRGNLYSENKESGFWYINYFA
jgi:hypothetical protein